MLDDPFLRGLHSPLTPLSELRRVHLETMKGLSDLSSVAAAPVLEELLVLDMGHLHPEAFQPFVGHPRLRAATIGLGSTRKNAAVKHLLPLPEVASRDWEHAETT